MGCKSYLNLTQTFSNTSKMTLGYKRFMERRGCLGATKKYPCDMAQDKQVAKLSFVSLLAALWVLIFKWEMGWVMTLLLIVPLTALIALWLAFALNMIIEPLVRWFNK